MLVKFNSAQRLGGKYYVAGEHPMQDKLAYTQEFKAMVKAGLVSMPPKNQSAQDMQARRDALAAEKAALGAPAFKPSEDET